MSWRRPRIQMIGFWICCVHRPMWLLYSFVILFIIFVVLLILRAYVQVLVLMKNSFAQQWEMECSKFQPSLTHGYLFEYSRVIFLVGYYYVVFGCLCFIYQSNISFCAFFMVILWPAFSSVILWMLRIRDGFGPDRAGLENWKQITRIIFIENWLYQWSSWRKFIKYTKIYLQSFIGPGPKPPLVVNCCLRKK